MWKNGPVSRSANVRVIACSIYSSALASGPCRWVGLGLALASLWPHTAMADARADAIARGTTYLLEQQREDGSFGRRLDFLSTTLVAKIKESRGEPVSAITRRIDSEQPDTRFELASAYWGSGNLELGTLLAATREADGSFGDPSSTAIALVAIIEKGGDPSPTTQYILGRQNSDGSFSDIGRPALVNALYCWALSKAAPGTPSASACADYLALSQSPDGSWYGEADSTAIGVLTLEGAIGHGAASRAAVGWLEGSPSVSSVAGLWRALALARSGTELEFGSASLLDPVLDGVFLDHTAWRDTAEAGVVLRHFGVEAPASGIRTWLAEHDALDADSEAYRILGLASSGGQAATPLGSLLLELASKIASDNDHPGMPGWRSRSIAVRACREAGLENEKGCLGAEERLLADADTLGYPFDTNQDPDITAAGTVLDAAGPKAGEQFGLGALLVLRSGADLILANQNADGSVGSGDDLLLKSVQALLGLQGVNDDRIAERFQLIDFVIAAQSPDGSWEGDVYLTALALRSLALEPVNLHLVKEAFTVSDALPRYGDNVTIGFEAVNTGPGDFSPSEAHLVFRTAEGDSEVALITLPALGPGQGYSGQTLWNTFGYPKVAGELVIDVDPDNLVAESDEDDNAASLPVEIIPGVDLEIGPDSLSIVRNPAGPNETVSLNARVFNRGAEAIGSFALELFEGDPASGGTLLQAFEIDSLASRAWVSRTVTVRKPLGDYEYFLVADSDDRIAEDDETNNVTSRTLHVIRQIDARLKEGTWFFQSRPDWLLGNSTNGGLRSKQDLIGDPRFPVDFTALVENPLREPMQDVEVLAEYQDALGVWQVIRSETFSLIPGEGTVVFSFRWAPPVAAGSFPVRIRVDPYDLQTETDEGNNETTLPFELHLLPDFSVSKFTNLNTQYGAILSFRVEAIKGASDLELSGLYCSLNRKLPDGTLVELSRDLMLSPVNQDEYTNSINYVYTSFYLPGDHLDRDEDFVAVIDPDNSFEEMDETNNTGQLHVHFANAPDLTLAPPTIGAVPNPAEEGDRIRLSYTAKNIGDGAMPASQIACYDELTGGAEIHRAYVPAFNTNLAAGASKSDYFDLETLDQPGVHPIHCKLDDLDAVNEVDESNNRFDIELDVGPSVRPDLAIGSEDIRVSPSTGIRPGDLASVDVAIHNLRKAPAPVSTLNLYRVDSAGSAVLIGSSPVSPIGGQSSDTVTVPWDTTGLASGAWTLAAVVDESNVIDEPDESNNRALAYIEVSTGTSYEPINLVAAAQGMDVQLDWDAPAASDLTGYYAYVDGELDSRFDEDLTSVGTFIYSGKPGTGGSLNYLHDNSSTIAWAGTGNPGPVTLALEFPQYRYVKSVYLDEFITRDSGYSFEVQMPSGEWRVVASEERPITSFADRSFVLDPPVKTRRIRLNFPYVTTNTVQIKEMDVTGVPLITSTSWPEPDQTPGIHNYWVTGVDPQGLESAASNIATLAISAVGMPAGLSVSTTYRTSSISWLPNSEPDLAGYLLWRDGELVVPPVLLASANVLSFSSNNNSTNSYRVLDGSTSTVWGPSSSINPSWIEMDLDRPRVFDAISIDLNNASKLDSFRLEGLIRGEWVPLLEMPGFEDLKEYPVPVQKVVSRIRLTFDYRSSYSVIEVYLKARDIIAGSSWSEQLLAAGTHEYQLVAVNDLGDLSDPAIARGVILPPNPPASVTTTPLPGANQVNWTASPDPDIAGYRLYRNGNVVGGLPAPVNIASKATYSKDPEPTVTTWNWGLLTDGLASPTLIFGLIPQTLYAQWDTSQRIEAVEFDWQSANSCQGLEISSWKNGRWELELEGGNIAQTITGTSNTRSRYTFPEPIFADRLRMHCRAGATVIIMELRLFAPGLLTALQAMDTLPPSGLYAYGVSAEDTAGNESAVTPADTTLDVGALEPPVLSASVAGHDVSLDWTPSASPEISGYRIFRDGVRINPGSYLEDSASVSSTYTTSPATYAVDASLATSWYPLGTLASHTWSATWPTARKSSDIQLTFIPQSGSTFYPISFDMNACLGGSCTVLFSTSSNSTRQYNVQPPVAVQFDRIDVTVYRTNSQWARLADIQIVDWEAATSTHWVDSVAHAGVYGYQVEAYSQAETSQRSNRVVVEVTDPGTVVLSAPTIGVCAWLGDLYNRMTFVQVAGSPDYQYLRIYRNGELQREREEIPGHLVGNYHQYLDQETTPFILHYEYRAQAVDADGHVSPMSDPCIIDITPPSPPGGALIRKWQDKHMRADWEAGLAGEFVDAWDMLREDQIIPVYYREDINDPAFATPETHRTAVPFQTLSNFDATSVYSTTFYVPLNVRYEDGSSWMPSIDDPSPSITTYFENLSEDYDPVTESVRGMKIRWTDSRHAASDFRVVAYDPGPEEVVAEVHGNTELVNYLTFDRWVMANRYRLEILQRSLPDVPSAIDYWGLIRSSATLTTSNQPYFDLNVPVGTHEYKLFARNQFNLLSEPVAVSIHYPSSVDYALPSSELVLSPAHPVLGSTASLLALVVNNGKESPPVDLDVMSTPEGGAPVSIYHEILDGLLPGDRRVVSIFVPVTDHDSRLEIWLDKENTVEELNEENNYGRVQLTVGPGEIPDLEARTLAKSGAYTDPDTLLLDGIALVGIVTTNENQIEVPFKVSIFEDLDQDGEWTSGVDLALGETTVPGMEGNDGLTVEVPVHGLVSYRDPMLFARVDSGDDVVEHREDNNIADSGQQCAYSAPDAGGLDVKVKKQWEFDMSDPSLPQYNSFGTASVPMVLPLFDTNGDGAVDGRDDTMITFSTYSYPPPPGDTPPVQAPRWVLNGATGATEAYWTKSHFEQCYVAAGKFFGDGQPTLVGVDLYGNMLVQNMDGIVDKHYGVSGFNGGGRLVCDSADLEHDGVPEFLCGGAVINNDFIGRFGRPLASQSFLWPYPNPFAADIDLDGNMEVIIGGGVFRHDGTPYCTIDLGINELWDMPDANFAVGNFDNDAYPEIIYSNKGVVGMLDHECRPVWGPVRFFDSINRATRSSVPTIADFDGDGEPEIAINASYSDPREVWATNSHVYMLEGDGSIGWRSEERTLDESPGAILGLSAFDFNRDGAWDLAFADASKVYIFNGIDGSTLWSVPHSSITGLEYPVIADVDKDGAAELVVSSTRYYGIYQTVFAGVEVYSGENDDWPATDSIWNHFNYYVGSTEPDGSVPQYAEKPWLTHNTFRAARMYSGIADPSVCCVEAELSSDHSSAHISALVGNGGASPILKTLVADFYDGDPDSGGTYLGSDAIAGLQPRESLTVGLDIDNLVDGQVLDIRVVVRIEGQTQPSGPTDPMNCRSENDDANLNLRVDSAAPQLSVENPPDASYWNRDFNAVAEVSDLVSGVREVRLSVDGQPFTTLTRVIGDFNQGLYSQPMEVLTLGDGPHHLEFDATDNEGFGPDFETDDANPVPVDFIVDTVPPVVEASNLTDGELKPGAFTPDVSAADLHLDTVTTTLNGYPFALGQPVSLNGFYELVVTADDLAGNTTTRRWSFRIADTGQMVFTARVSPDKAEYAWNEPVGLTLGALDGGSSVFGQFELRATLTPVGGGSMMSATFAYETHLAGQWITRAWSFAPGELASGDYVTDLELVFEDGTPLATDEARFTIRAPAEDPGASLAGQLDLSTRLLEQNQPLGILRTLLNAGSTPVAAVGVTTRIIPVGQTTALMEDAYSLGLGGEESDARTWSIGTGGLAPGSYWVVLAASVDGGPEQALDIDQFLLLESNNLPPLLSVESPAEGEVVGANVDLLARASDTDSGIDFVEAQADGEPESLVLVRSSGDATDGEYGILWQPAVGGPRTVVFTAHDLEGATAQQTVHVIVDLTGPAVTVASPADGSCVDADAADVSGTTDGDAASVEANGIPGTVGGGAFNVSGVPLAQDSINLVSVSVSDPVGNTGLASVSVIEDSTIPVVSISGVPATGLSSGDVTPVVTASDANLVSTTATVTLDGQPVSWSEGVALTQEGGYAVTVEATDCAGHTATASASFVIDKTAPTAVIVSPADGACVDADTTDVSGTADGDAASVEANGLPGTVGVGAFNVSGIPLTQDSYNTISVSVSDTAGNTGTASVSVTEDSTDPAVSITGVPATGLTSGNVTPVVTASDTNLVSVTTTVMLDGQPVAWTDGTTLTQDGSYAISVVATDCAGHTASASASFAIDKTAPAVVITSPVDGACLDADTADLGGTTNSDAATVKANGLSGSVGSGIFNVTGVPLAQDSSNTISVSVSDAAGNSGTASVSVIEDSTPPVIWISGIPASGLTNGDVTPVVTASDANLVSVTTAVMLDGGPLAWSEGTALAAEGSYTVTVEATDCAGHTATALASFVIDKTPPTVVITSPADGSCVDADSVDVTGTTSADATSVVANGLSGSVGGGTFNVTGVPLEQDSTNTMSVAVSDAAGNTGTASVSVTEDSTSPVVSIAGIPASGITNGDVTPVISASDAHLVTTTTTVTLDGLPISWSEGLALTAEGSYTVTVEATDCAGHTASESASFVIDKSALTVTVDSPADGSCLDADAVDVTGTTDADAVSVEANGVMGSVSGGAFNVPGVPLVQDAANNLSVTASDAAGNMGTSSILVIEDSTDPVVSISGIPASGLTNGDVTPVVSATDANLVSTSTTVTMDGLPVSWSEGAALTADGSYSISVEATDCAGHTASASASFVIDKTAPTVAITSPSDSSCVDADAADVSGTTSGDAISVEANGVGGSVGGGTFNVSGVPLAQDSSNTISVAVSDAAGNTGTSSILVIEDSTAPAVSISGIPATGLTNGDVTPLTTASDANLVSSTTTVTLDGQPVAWTEGTALTQDGSYTIRVEATDCAGHTAAASASFVIDKTAPSVAIASPADGSCVDADTVDVSGTASADAATVEANGIGGSVGGGTFNVSGVPLAQDSTNSISVVISDAAGNTGTASVTLTEDSTDPVVSISGVPASGLTNGDVTPVVTASDANLVSTTTTVTLDGLPVAWTEGTVLTSEGGYTITVLSSDCAGHTASATASFMIDKTDPSVAIASPADGSCVDANSVDVSGTTSADATSVVANGLSGAVGGGAFNVSGIMLAQDSSNIISVSVSDAAGNTGTASVSVTEDSTGPVVLISNIPATGLTSSDVTPVVTASDANLVSSIITVTLDGLPVAWTEGTSLTAEGGYTITVEATDCASHTASASSSFVIDRTAPTVAVANPADGSCVDADSVEVSGTADGDAATVEANGMSGLVGGGAFTVSGIPLTQDSTNTITVAVSDATGNTGTASVSVTEDSTDPVVSITGIPGTGFTGTDVTPVVTASDANLVSSIITVTLDGLPLAWTEGTSFTAEGGYSVTVEATDCAGHTATAAASFVIDRTAPTVAIADPADGFCVDAGTVEVSGTTDGDAASVEANGLPGSVGDGAFNVTGIALTQDSSNTINVSVTDGAGNTGTASATVTEDSTDPAVSISGIPATGITNGDVTPVISASDANLVSTVTSVERDGQPVPWIDGQALDVEGGYTVTVQATDCAGHTATATAAFVIDRTAPEVFVTSHSDGECLDADSVILGGTSSADAIDVQVNSQEALLSASEWQAGPLPLGPDAVNSFVVEASDEAGNSGGYVLSLIEDSTDPVVAISGVPASGLTNGDVTPVVSASDANLVSSTTTVALNGAQIAWTGGTALVAEGSYTVTVEATDCAGHRASASASFVIDKTAPSVTIANPADGACVDADAVVVNGTTSADATSVVADNVPGSVVGGTYNVPGVPLMQDSSNTIGVAVSDAAGNTGTASTTVTEDSTDPVVSISGVPASGLTNVDVTPVVTASDANLVSTATTVTLDGQPLAWTDGTALVAEGSYTITVEATDCAGHMASASASFVIDKTAPTVAIVSPTDGACVDAESVDVTGTTNTDATSVVANGLPGSVGGGAFNVPGVPLAQDASNTLSVAVSDAAGNTGTASVSVTEDSTDPVVAISGIPASGLTNSGVTPAVTVSDANLVSTTTTVTLDGQPVAWTGGTTLTQDGSYTVTVEATDCAGHTASASASFVIDKTAPTVAITSPTDGACVDADAVGVNGTTSADAVAVESNGLPGSVGGGAFNVPGVPLAQDASNTVSVAVSDAAGNAGTASVSVTEDSTPPVVSISGTPPTGLTNSDVTPVVTASDANLVSTTTTVTHDGLTIAWSEGTALTAEGSYAITVEATDCAGHTATTSVSFVIDKTAPEVLVSSHTDGECLDADSVSLAGTASADTQSVTVNGFAATLALPDWQTGALALSPDSVNAFAVQTSDPAGNSDGFVLSLVEDSTPPAITVAGVADGAVYGGTVTPVVGISDANLVSGDLTLDGLSYASGTPVSAEGVHLLEAVAEDCAGHVTQASVSFEIQPGSGISLTVSKYEITSPLRGTRILLWTPAPAECLPGGGGSDDCAKIDCVNTLLTMSGIDYDQVYTAPDFQRGLRSGEYGTYLVLDAFPHLPFWNPLDRHQVASELTEAVRYGDGLVIHTNTVNLNNDLAEAMGARLADARPEDVHTLLLDNDLFDGGQFSFAGRKHARNVTEVAPGSVVRAWYDTGEEGIVSTVFAGTPGGRSVLMPFELCQVMGDPANEAAAASVLGRALEWVSPSAPRPALPQGPLTVAIDIDLSGGDATLQAHESLPLAFTVVSANEGGLIGLSSIDWSRWLTDGSRWSLEYETAWPDGGLSGSYTLHTEVSYDEGGGPVPGAATDLVVSPPADLIGTGERIALVGTIVGGWTLPPGEANQAAKALAHLSDVETMAAAYEALGPEPPGMSPGERSARLSAIEAILASLVDAVDDLKKVQSADISAARHEVDALIRSWSMRWSRVESR